MLKRTGSEGSAKKIPIRTPRATQNTQPYPMNYRIIAQKYLPQSVNAFYFRKTQEYLCSRPNCRQLSFMGTEEEFMNRYMVFEDIKGRIKRVVTQRVEKDYLFGTTFHEAWRVLNKYVRVQRRMRQRNVFNRYYFGSCPPKVSMITQPTTTTLHTLKGPQTTSTLELKVLTQNLQIMLQPQGRPKNPHNGTPDKRNKDKSEKTRRKLKSQEDIPQQNYGLRSYKKVVKAKSRGKGQVSKGSLWQQSKMTLCVTPQPHGAAMCQSPSSVQPRLSERSGVSDRSGGKQRGGSGSRKHR